MILSIELPAYVANAMRHWCAEKRGSISDDTLRTAALFMVIEELRAADLVTYENITRALFAAEAEVAKQKAEEAAAAAPKENAPDLRPANPLQPSSAGVAVPVKKKPKQSKLLSDLPIPMHMRAGMETAPWQVWTFAVKQMIESMPSRWYSFTVNDVAQSIKMKPTKADSALRALEGVGWLVHSEKGASWEFSAAAKTWLTKKSNQEVLIELGVISRINQDDGTWVHDEQ